MNKQVKLPNQPVKNVTNQKKDIKSVTIIVPFDIPDYSKPRPLHTITVCLELSDDNHYTHVFDFIPDYGLDKYVQLTTTLFHQFQNDSINQAK